MAVFLSFWLMGIIYFVSDSESSEKTSLQMKLKTLEYIRLDKSAQMLEVENEKLRRGLLNLQVDMKNPQFEDSSCPSREYEESRRTFKRDVNEMWWQGCKGS